MYTVCLRNKNSVSLLKKNLVNCVKESTQNIDIMSVIAKTFFLDYVCMYVCLCDYTHTIQPNASNFGLTFLIYLSKKGFLKLKKKCKELSITAKKNFF